MQLTTFPDQWSLAITFSSPYPNGSPVSHAVVDQDGFITIQRVEVPKLKGKRRNSDKRNAKNRKLADAKSKAATKW